MNRKIAELLESIRQAEAEIEQELERRRSQFEVEFVNRRVRFRAEVVQTQRQFKTGLLRYLGGADWRSLVAALVMYPMIVPLVVLDLGVSLYQLICFPMFRIQRVQRRDCFAYDRSQLAYLNAIEKLNCAYCSYANGLAAYLSAIFARTEQYWCPIKHARRMAQAQQHDSHFLDYGDAAGWHNELAALRRRLAELERSERQR